MNNSYQYNSANQRTRCRLADGSRWIYEYDFLGQLISAKHYWPDWTPVAGQQFEYAFDDIGNRTATKAGGDENALNLGTASYGANRLNQYTNRTVPGGVDVMGLALATESVTVNSQSAYRKGEYFRKELAVDNTTSPLWTNITVSASPETDVTGKVFVPQTAEQFTYDLDGNLTTDGRWTNRWDAENRLIGMESLTNGPTGSKLRLIFSYDSRSRRITKQVESWSGSAWTNAVSNKFLYDGWNLIAQLNGTNNAAIEMFMWGTDLSGRLQGAGGVSGLLAINDYSLGAYFAYFDGNGNTCGLLAAGDGASSANYEYGPFGEPLRGTGPVASSAPLAFSTKYRDNETDFLYYGYRFLRPDIGRWLSHDPIFQKGGLNTVGFVGNAPTTRTDLNGLIGNPPIGPSGPPRPQACPFCMCVRVKMSPGSSVQAKLWAGGPTDLGQNAPFTLSLAIHVAYSIEVIGDPRACRCKYTDYGSITQHIGSLSPMSSKWDPPKVTHIDCTDGEDVPGPVLGVGEHGSTTYTLDYNWSGTLTCEGSPPGLSMSVQDTSSLSGSFQGTWNW